MAVIPEMPQAMVGDSTRVWALTLTDGGTAADLTGCTAAGYADRPDGTSVAMSATVGTGGAVTVAVPQNALAMCGWLRLFVIVMSGDDRLCTACCRVRVVSGESSQIVDPGTVYPGYGTVVAELEEVKSAVSGLPHIYYAATEAEMETLTGMSEGDLCFVPAAEE